MIRVVKKVKDFHPDSTKPAYYVLIVFFLGVPIFYKRVAENEPAREYSGETNYRYVIGIKYALFAWTFAAIVLAILAAAAATG